VIVVDLALVPSTAGTLVKCTVGGCSSMLKNVSGSPGCWLISQAGGFGFCAVASWQVSATAKALTS
jgi:hypothetical protein